MSQPPRGISCVVTFHREGGYAHTTLRSIDLCRRFAETRGREVELIAVLDRADARTRRAMEASGCLRSGDTVLEVDNGDLSLSRNQGIARARLDLVAILDGDDYPCETWLDASASVIEQHGEHVICAPEVLFMFGARQVYLWRASQNSEKFDPAGLLSINYWGATIVAARTSFVAIPYAPCFVEETGFGFEDWHRNCEAIASGYEFRTVDETVAFVRQKWSNSLNAAQDAANAIIRPTRLFDRPEFLKQPTGDRLPWTGTEQPVPQWVRNAMRPFSGFDGTLLPDQWSVASAKFYEMPDRWERGRAYGRMLEALDGFRPTHIIAVPWLKRGGYDLGMLHHANTLSRAFGARVLVVATVPTDSPWAARLADGTRFVNITEFGDGLDAADHEAILLRYIVQTQPRVLHIGNSLVAWAILRRTPRPILNSTSVFSTLVCDGITGENAPVGYARYFLADTEPYLAGVFSDNTWYPKRLAADLGIEASLFTVLHFPTEIPEAPKFRALEGRKSVLWAGRFDHQKRPELLAGIAQLLPDHAFHVYGEKIDEIPGGESDPFAGLPNVHVHGGFDGFSSLPVESFDLFLHTSAYDGLPNVLLEATAAGLPVVAGLIGGVGDFIDETTAYPVTDTQSAEAYAAAIASANSDIGQARIRWQRAFERLHEQHSQSRFEETLERLAGYARARPMIQTLKIDGSGEALRFPPHLSTMLHMGKTSPGQQRLTDAQAACFLLRAMKAHLDGFVSVRLCLAQDTVEWLLAPVASDASGWPGAALGLTRFLAAALETRPDLAGFKGRSARHAALQHAWLFCALHNEFRNIFGSARVDAFLDAAERDRFPGMPGWYPLGTTSFAAWHWHGSLPPVRKSNLSEFIGWWLGGGAEDYGIAPDRAVAQLNETPSDTYGREFPVSMLMQHVVRAECRHTGGTVSASRAGARLLLGRWLNRTDERRFGSSLPGWQFAALKRVDRACTHKDWPLPIMATAFAAARMEHKPDWLAAGLAGKDAPARNIVGCLLVDLPVGSLTEVARQSLAPLLDRPAKGVTDVTYPVTEEMAARLEVDPALSHLPRPGEAGWARTLAGWALRTLWQEAGAPPAWCARSLAEPVHDVFGLPRGLVAIAAFERNEATGNPFQDAADAKAWIEGLGAEELERFAWMRFGGEAHASGLVPWPDRRPGGVQLCGWARGELGIGEDVRMGAAALSTIGTPHIVLDTSPGLSAREADRTLEGRISRRPIYHASIFFLAALDHYYHVIQSGSTLRDGRYNIGVWPWELPKWPDEFDFVYDMVDEVWAPSTFIQGAFDKGHVPVRWMPPAVEVEMPAPVARGSFGLPEGAYVFLTTLDANSTLARKNPAASILAFRTAFPVTRTDVRLVIKVTNAQRHPDAWRDVTSLAAGDGRITFITETFDRSRLMQLLAQADAFVSLHRAEGFGRNIAEAMLLAKPVIVSAFSGNMDFTNEDNAFLVGGRTRRLKTDEYPHWQEQHWFEPDTVAAAEAMRTIYDDRSEASRRGTAGQALIREEFSAKAAGKRYAARLGELHLI